MKGETTTTNFQHVNNNGGETKIGSKFEDLNEKLVFPYYASGTVVKGFGRGSKELGIPTANFPDDVVNKLPDMYQQGVYFGWANVDNGPVHKMVMSIGNNPYYNNEKRTMETHIMHKFDSDFYGSQLKIVMTGYLRAMTNFKCLGKTIFMITCLIYYYVI